VILSLNILNTKVYFLKKKSIFFLSSEVRERIVSNDVSL